MPKPTLAIIGNGPAGGRLVEEIVARGGTDRWDVAVYGEEPLGCYNRILLSKVLGGAGPESIMLRDAGWYSARGVRLVTGLRVERLDTSARVMHFSDGSSRTYDEAVFATGSKAMVPPTDGLLDRDHGRLRPGAFVFRTVDDCLKVRAWARPGMKAAVVGGGLLGLEAAKGLHDLGLDVTIVHLADWLMERQLDRTGGDLLRRTLESMGISVRTGASTKKVLGAEKVEGLWFADGSTLPAELAVFACGIRPRIEAAELSGVPVGRGIFVDDVMASKVAGVSAVGECAEHRGVVYGIVSPIWDQVKALADRLAGAGKLRFDGARLYTRLKVAGVEVASMGLTEPERPEDEVVQVIEERRRVYRKLIVRDGRLAGAMLVGDASAAASLLSVFDRGDPVPANRLDLLATPMPTVAGGGGRSGDIEVCNCHRVGERAVIDAIRGGCRSLESLAGATRAGTGCGSCRGQLAQLILRNSPKATV
jgi:nitrite reductase (NADH) large subunit